VSLETPWQRAKKSRSVRQEERNGKLEGGSKQINSGRTWRSHRDNILREFLVESRDTESRSYSISKDEWSHIRLEALKTPPGLLPGMQIDIQDLSLMVIELTAFQDLYNRLVALEAQAEDNEKA
jgi:hypothetical protein